MLTHQDSLTVEAEFEDFKAEALAKYEQSVRDLEVAQDIQNRTAALQLFTQDQLLQVERKLFICGSHRHCMCTLFFCI